MPAGGDVSVCFTRPGSLGLKFTEPARGKVQLLAVSPGTQAEIHAELQPGLLLTTVGGSVVAGLRQALEAIKVSGRPLTLRFRVDDGSEPPMPAAVQPQGPAGFTNLTRILTAAGPVRKRLPNSPSEFRLPRSQQAHRELRVSQADDASSPAARRAAAELERHFGGQSPSPAAADAEPGPDSAAALAAFRATQPQPRHRGGEVDVKEQVATAALEEAEASLLAATVHAAAHWAGHQPNAGPVVPSTSQRCWICRAEFSLFLRQKYCRDCGNSVCDDHSLQRARLPLRGFGAEPQRVCDLCYRDPRERCMSDVRAAHAMQWKLHSVMKLADAVKEEQGVMEQEHSADHMAQNAAHDKKVYSMQMQLVMTLKEEHHAHEHAVQELSAKNKADVVSLTNHHRAAAAAHLQTVASMQSAHETALTTHGTQHEEAVATLQEEWEARVAGRDRTAAAVQVEWEARVAAKESTMEALQVEWEARVAAKEASGVSALEAARAEHAAESAAHLETVSELESASARKTAAADATVAAVEEASEAALEAALGSHQKSLGEQTAAHQERLHAAEASELALAEAHESALANLVEEQAVALLDLQSTKAFFVEQEAGMKQEFVLKRTRWKQEMAAKVKGAEAEGKRALALTVECHANVLAVQETSHASALVSQAAGYDAAIAQLRTDLQADALKKDAEHEAALAAAAAQHEAVVATLTANLVSALSATEDAAHQDRVFANVSPAKIKADHARAAAQLEAEHEVRLASQAAKYEEQLDSSTNAYATLVDQQGDRLATQAMDYEQRLQVRLACHFKSLFPPQISFSPTSHFSF